MKAIINLLKSINNYYQLVKTAILFKGWKILICNKVQPMLDF